MPDGKDDKDSKNVDQKDQVKIDAEVEKIITEKLQKQFEEEKEKIIKETATKEKAKLYESLEKEKQRAEAAEKKLKEIASEEEKKLAEEEQKKRDEMDAKERIKTLEDKLTETTSRFTEIMSLEKQTFSNELRKRDLELHKKDVLARFSGAIIPELVVGNSEEEIETAAKLSNAKYIEIVEASKQKVMDEIVSKGIIPKPDGKDKISKDGNVSAPKDYYEIFKMEKDKFEAWKQEALKEFLGNEQS